MGLWLSQILGNDDAPQPPVVANAIYTDFVNAFVEFEELLDEINALGASWGVRMRDATDQQRAIVFEKLVALNNLYLEIQQSENDGIIQIMTLPTTRMTYFLQPYNARLLTQLVVNSGSATASNLVNILLARSNELAPIIAEYDLNGSVVIDGAFTTAIESGMNAYQNLLDDRQRFMLRQFPCWNARIETILRAYEIMNSQD